MCRRKPPKINVGHFFIVMAASAMRFLMALLVVAAIQCDTVADLAPQELGGGELSLVEEGVGVQSLETEGEQAMAEDMVRGKLPDVIGGTWQCGWLDKGLR